MKSPKHVVPMIVALTLAAMLSGCSKNTTPTAPADIADTTVPTVPAVPAVPTVPTLDESPPALPAQIVAERDAVTGPATIEWTASSSANAASYQIYQYSPDPNRESAYVLIGETPATTTSYPLSESSLETTYYRLRTTSTTGVQSGWSAIVQVTVAPGGGGDPDPGDGIIIK